MAVHYRAWAEKTLHKFEDTWQEQRPFELVLGKGMYSALWYLEGKPGPFFVPKVVVKISRDCKV